MVITRGALRHPRFSALVQTIRSRNPVAAKIIDGAVWEIEHDPMGIGVHIKEIDVWQARLVMPSPPDLLLIYGVTSRLVTMLTIIAADGSNLD
jgi:hypothetical protein